MVTLDQKVRLHPEVVDTELDDGEMVLLHLESKTYYSLNLTGTRIWQGLKQGLTLQEISHRLQEEFDVEAGRADSSVLALVNELSQQQLVQSLD
jgi:hypothetical protein